LIFIVVLDIGLCDYPFFIGISDFIGSFIPAVESFAAGTRYSSEARSIWAALWMFSPITAFLFYRFTGGRIGHSVKPRILWILIPTAIGCFYACLYGFLNPVGHSTNPGKLTALYQDTLFGVGLISATFWLSFYSSVGGIITIIKDG